MLYFIYFRECNFIWDDYFFVEYVNFFIECDDFIVEYSDFFVEWKSVVKSVLILWVN